MEKSLSVNRLASRLLEKLVENPVFYGVTVDKTQSGVTIIDAGVDAKGGFQVGRLVTEICMGGLGKAKLTSRRYGGLELPAIFVFTDHPVIATLGSQYAGWQISEDGYFAIGSGPARALALKPKEIFEEIGYRDEYDKGIIVLETDKHPPADLLKRFTKDCGISAKNLVVVLTPTTSLAGATQVAGRIVETGIHKLRRLGLDPNLILHAWGVAPIPPVHPKFANAMARTNDAILYGGTAYYSVEYEDEAELKRLVEKAPSKASKDYGRPFIEIFKEVNMDFYKIDLDLFAPAIITVDNIKTGNTFQTGELNVNALMESFGFKSR